MLPADDTSPQPVSRPSALALLGAILAAAVVVNWLPGPLGGWASAVGTVAHEAGHALVADVLTGDVASITVFRDGGGVAFTDVSTSSWRTFLVSAAGYPATLLAALSLLTAVLLARSSRTVALVGALCAVVALVLWTPFNAQVSGIDDGDQRFTFAVLTLSALALFVAAALPDRFDIARRVVLGVFAVGLLADAFRAGRDLVLVEGRASQIATDADGLAEASGLFNARVWAWLLRLGLFAITLVWAAVVVGRRRPPT